MKGSDVRQGAVPCSWMWKMWVAQRVEGVRDRDRRDSLLWRREECRCWEGV